jgi:hypothetical protein
MVRLGQSWQVKTTTGIAALSALPTTVSHLGLYNAEPATGKVYVIDSVATWEAVQDGTQSDQTTLFVMLNRGVITAPANALTPVSLSGRTGYDGRAAITTGATGLTNDGWYPAGTSALRGDGRGGAVWKMTDVPLRGLYIVPPGGYFNIAATKIVGWRVGPVLLHPVARNPNPVESIT